MDLAFEAAFLNVCLLCILTVPHEFAHAWMASKLGDDTPEQEGRLTLYPPAHLELFGSIILPGLTSLLAGGFIGWGRPVNTNPAKLKYGLNGLAMVAMAGPASNMLLAVVFAGLSVLVGASVAAASEVAQRAALLSVYLGLFNLLPVPPLDGSKLLIALRFPVAVYVELARFGFVLLLLAMSLTNLGGYLAYYSQRITEFFFGFFY